MRTNYVLVDLENVQPDTLDELAHDHFKLFVFVGANQTKLPFELAASLQRLGARAEYVKISGNGSNALDFHIAYYIGQLAAADASAYFHIISKDTGFDPLIQHLKTKKIFAGRVKAVTEIPLIKASNSKSSTERIDVVLGKLKQLKASKPRTAATLSSTVASLFQKQLPEQEVATLVQSLVTQGHLSVVGTKVTYSLPSDG
jgi:predicted membrane GTPase involved in stress response